MRSFFVVLIAFLLSNEIVAQNFGLDRPPAEDEINYFPGDDAISGTNPPAFNWLPVKGVNLYIVQYSVSPKFEPDKTTTVRDIDMMVHIPTNILESGIWYWRYGYSSNGEELYSRVRRFTIPESAIRFPFMTVEKLMSNIPMQRPRLFFTPELVTEIRSDATGRFDHITENVIREAEKILKMKEPLFEEPEPYEKFDDPRRRYDATRNVFFPYSNRMVTCALAYLYTGNRLFAEEARRRLMGLMTWDVNGISTALKNDGLAMSIAENTPAVFDWIFDILNEEERLLCTKVITSRMIQINRDVHRARPMETRPFNSHHGRMVGFAIEGGIVLAHEAPEARDWLDYTLKLLWSTYPAWGHSDGGWHEGISYWSGYMRRMMRVVTQLDHWGIPLKNKPFFQNTGYYGLYAGYFGRATGAFGDGHERSPGDRQGELMYILSSLYSNPYFLWYAEETGAVLPSGRDAFLYNNPRLKSLPPADLPNSKAFKDIGLVVMHSQMNEPEQNVTMLFQSNPFGAISHNFACQNAFVIEAYGEPLAISTGSRQLYGSPHHSEWMWHTKAHNSILVDNKGQAIRQRSSYGKIIEFEENDDYVYTAGDATMAYEERLEKFHRHVLFLKPDYFIIIDDIKTSGTQSTYQWLLHSPTEIRVDQKRDVMVNQSGNVRLTTRFLTPDEIEYSQHTGFTPQVEDSTIWQNQFHLTASTIKPASSQRFVTVMGVDRTTETPPAKPRRPSSPRREVEINNIENSETLNKNILDARLIDAEGGIAIRVGNDLIIWKEENAQSVKAEGVISSKTMDVKLNFF